MFRKLFSEIEAGLFDLALMFTRSDNLTDATVYVDTLCSIRDCIENEIGDGTSQGLKTAAGQTGFISYTAGLLMSSVMFQRVQAVESGELNSYFPDGESRKDHYSLTHLKWVLAYCEDSGEYEWLKTE